jgi:glycosyltransferase involved in cell wall biosynthesis
MNRPRPSVLVVGHGPPTRGGIPSFLTGLVEDEWLADRALIEYFNTCPVSTKQPGAFTLSNLRLTLEHAAGVLRRSRRVDVVHLNLAPIGVLPLVRAMLISACAKLSGAAVILHAHAGGLAETASRSVLYRALMKLSKVVIDRIVVVSRDSESALSRLRGDVSFIANGIDLKEFTTEGREVGEPTLVFAGTVCERKGLLDLRDALLRLRENGSLSVPLKVKIAGDDAQEPGGFERMRSAFEAARLEVAFLGALSPPEMVALFREASIFCLPSHREGLPLSLLEAMGAGCGVIASRVGDIPYVLDNGDCGVLIEPHDVGALTAGIKRLVDDGSLCQMLGRRARFRVEQEFARRGTVMKLYDLYVESTGSRPALGESDECGVV